MVYRFAMRTMHFALAAMLAVPPTDSLARTPPQADLAAHVNPLIGTSNGGNTFPGPVVPFGMFSWSPENTRGDMTRAAAPGGYHYDATRIRGFSLSHLSGAVCRGASGDIPFMPHVGGVTSSPSTDAKNEIHASDFAHADERASAGAYQVRLKSGGDGRESARAWLPESFVTRGGTLRFTLSPTALPSWGAAPADTPPSFPPR
jgi:putative alpha-1,2-mannosidase